MPSLNETFHIAVPTAFNSDESLNAMATIQHVINLQKNGIHSVLISGSTGEQHSLSNHEKKKLLLEIANVDGFKNNFEIIFGISNIRQKKAENLAQFVHKIDNVKAILVGFSPYVIPTQAEAIQYFKSIVALADKPTIIYNNPRRTGFDLSIDSIIEISQDPRVVGIKEAGNPKRIKELLQRLPPNKSEFYVYAGGEKNLAENISLGFNRMSSIWGNLYPSEIKNWFNALSAGKLVSLPETVENTMLLGNKGSLLPFLKQEISKKENISLGPCRKPLGN
ncbi:dihydrodipicolinate synthase family protein [Liquorilactobacillus hordei]|uniref:Dihydrodipicolinate synthase family protein n=1 Tax=Liquorilactobacillus hordei TaxID=468911 RepID=A0A3Q8CAC8_9LACO|nr:dihydrodipicolinate synthase family protein [Liquorilactobacillus hordei]AUJ30410.1 hypothetical protein BSQ49_09585 [Liquorilactobacillus hordei]